MNHLRSEEETHNLATHVFATCLLMIHDAVGRGQDNMAKLTRWKEVTGKLLDSCHRNIEPGRDHTTLVDAANELHHYFSCSVVINNLQVSNVAVFLHHLQKLDDDLGVGPDQNLALSTLLSIDNVVQAIAQDTDSNHVHQLL